MARIWRQEDTVLNQAGEVVKGGMWPHQRLWWNSDNHIKALITGYGGGKTFIAGKRAIALALHNAPAPHLSVSPSHKIAKRTTIPTITALLSGKAALLPGLKYRYNKSDGEIQISYRGRKGIIWFGSGDDPDSLKGPNVGSSNIDEPFIQDRLVFDQVFARTRHPQARVREIGLTGTPEELNWGYDICEGEERDKYDLFMVNASTLANLALPEEFRKQIQRAFTDKAAQAYIDGKFVNLTSGLVYYAFNPEYNVKRLPDPGHELEVGMDFNVDPMSAIIFWRNGEHMHIVAEKEIENSDTEYMAQYIKDNWQFPEVPGEPILPRATTVYPDASGRSRHTNAPGGRSDFHYLKEAGFEINAPSANPKIRDRENAINAKFKPRQGKSTLTIDPSCKKLIGYLHKYTHENKNKPDHKRMSHLLDATGYPVSYIYGVHRPSVVVSKLIGH